ncbi:hypothetical protein OG949_23825 [Streptomyces scopuliridis]|uniref:hypothetical protein n=1 Tax=Streptomyces scopuliridis TaxID=452529 RepID=UPI002DD8B8DD|nr:hypothetical protein [Streptomyces scopuliridis]WSB35569.1 hypothetical protein OG949_23825 [Streptomyces scopuliridis]
MPQRALNRPFCSHCDGFPLVAVTTGQRSPNGQRKTITAACPACNGTGHTTPAATLARVGR